MCSSPAARSRSMASWCRVNRSATSALWSGESRPALAPSAGRICGTYSAADTRTGPAASEVSRPSASSKQRLVLTLRISATSSHSSSSSLSGMPRPPGGSADQPGGRGPSDDELEWLDVALMVTSRPSLLRGGGRLLTSLARRSAVLAAEYVPHILLPEGAEARLTPPGPQGAGRRSVDTTPQTPSNATSAAAKSTRRGSTISMAILLPGVLWVRGYMVALRCAQVAPLAADKPMANTLVGTLFALLPNRTPVTWEQRQRTDPRPSKSRWRPRCSGSSNGIRWMRRRQRRAAKGGTQ